MIYVKMVNGPYLYEGHTPKMYDVLAEEIAKCGTLGDNTIIYGYNSNLDPKTYCFKIRENPDFDIGESGA